MFTAAISAVPDAVRIWVRDIVNGVYGYLHGLFGLIGDGWDRLESAAFLAWHAVTGFMDEAVTAFYRILHVIIPAVITAYRLAVSKVEQYATDIYRWSLREFALARAALDAAISGVRNFVVNDVWRPLHNDVTAIIDWIRKIGDVVWYYISHPAVLVDLIWDHLIFKLEAESWNVAAKLGRFGLSLVVRHVKRFALLAEDILDAIL